MSAKSVRLAAAAALCALLAGPALAATDPLPPVKAGPLSLEVVWARATASSAKAGAAYLTIVNGGADDRLTAAASPVAETVELHTHIMDGSVARMRKVEGGIEIPGDAELVLEPGGLHVMLMGLKQPLKPGESFPLTLTFEKAGTVGLTAQVRAPGDEPDAHAGHDHDHEHGDDHDHDHDHGDGKAADHHH
ncbi:copper chaperone PCu(A)C [Rhodocista pekingensis]|uniref:Copper chaperone PCu(A)C n=1 Tax=Rhodocista pekingensis TaxID=201185 RepID=A0ABW2KU17_9PROT